MPQIREEDIPDFLNFVRQKNIQVKKSTMKISELLPTQNEVNPERIVAKVQKAGKVKPFIISSDNYILDGHHQLYALKYIDPKTAVTVYKVSVPMKEFINIAKSYPRVSYKSL